MTPAAAGVFYGVFCTDCWLKKGRKPGSLGYFGLEALNLD